MKTEIVINYEQFLKECATFRKTFQDGSKTIAEMDKAFGCLFFIVNNTDPNDPKKELIQSHWEALANEWMRRKELMIMRGHPLG